MIREIGSMVSLHVGSKLYDALKDDDNVIYLFIETARSEDLFDDKQFGEFGEAAILTILVDEKDEDEVFSKIYEYSDLPNADNGIIFTGQPIGNYL